MDLIEFKNIGKFDFPQEIVKCFNDHNKNENNSPILIHCK